jgi:PPOX class probable F420-dependent enzyme
VSIRLSDDEAWAALEAAHTGILTTLRADGRPVTLPVWFVVVDRSICVSTPPGSKKVHRIRRDPRSSFLVESGAEWRALTGVHVSGRIAEVDDESQRTAVRAALDEKYRPFRLPVGAMPASARQRYAEFTILRLVPEGRMLTWDNSRLRLRS